MQISLEWINELVDLESIPLDELINKLTLSGFEVEEVLEIELEKKKVTALDISATANRSDSLSIQGLALEIAALLNNAPNTSEYSLKNFPWAEKLKTIGNRNLKNENCSGFLSVQIDNLINFTSPKWLQEKIISSGLKPQNNLSDFQNYITLETGYPIEIYDFDKIISNCGTSDFILNLKSINDSQIFTASNETNYQIDNSILILTANQRPISIAGLISDESTLVSNTTKSVLIEASIFNAAKIRQESRKLGLRTERSSRYEKSLKNTNLLNALYRLISLLRVTNPDLECRFHTVSLPGSEAVKTIQLSYKNVKEVLGPIKQVNNESYEYISIQNINSALARLQFGLEYDDENQQWQVSIPSLRTDDIVREIDLIEEIGRIYGFNNFLTRLPSIKRVGSKDFDYQIRQKLTSCLINMGLNELIQYSLVNTKTYLQNEVELINPLVKDYSNLRLSLLPNLISAVEENIKNGNSILEGFEYGHVFSTDSSLRVQEIEHLAGIFGGLKTKSSWSETLKSLSWFQAKGNIEQLLNRINIHTQWKPYDPIQEKSILHPYRSAKIVSQAGRELGVFGQISPILAKKLNISTDFYLFEFNFEAITEEVQANKLSVYQEYSSYPKIIKDLSFIVKTDITFSKIQKLLYLNGSQFLTEVTLLDEYQGSSIPENHISLCLKLVFQSKSDTLQTKKIEKIINNLIDLLEQNFDATIRV